MSIETEIVKDDRAPLVIAALTGISMNLWDGPITDACGACGERPWAVRVDCRYCDRHVMNMYRTEEERDRNTDYFVKIGLDDLESKGCTHVCLFRLVCRSGTLLASIIDLLEAVRLP